VTYYDRTNRTLALSVENGAGTNMFTEASLDAASAGDRGVDAVQHPLHAGDRKDDMRESTAARTPVS